MNKKIIVGILLVFTSGMFYRGLVAVFVVVFGGGKLRDGDGDLVYPSPEFFTGAFSFALYGLPFLIVGLYLIKKSRSENHHKN